MIMNAFDSSVKTFFLKNAGFVETLLSNRNKSFGSLNHNAGAYISKRSIRNTCICMFYRVQSVIKLAYLQ